MLGYLENAANTWSSPGTGFTEATNVHIVNTGAFSQSVWWKIASGEPASWTWTPANTGWRAVVVTCYSGGSGSGNFLDVEGTPGQADGASSVTVAGLTTTAANDLYVAVAVNWQGTGWSITSGETGLTIRVDMTGTAIISVNDVGAAGAKADSVINAGTCDYTAGHVAFLLTGAGGASTVHPKGLTMVGVG